MTRLEGLDLAEKRSAIALTDAMMDLYECMINPAHFTKAANVLESWLISEQDPVEIAMLEERSNHIWSLMANQKYEGDISIKSTKPNFTLAVEDALDGDRYPEGYQAVFHAMQPNDLVRFREWIKDDCESCNETLARYFADESEAATICLVRKFGEMCEYYILENTLDKYVEDLFRTSFDITNSEILVLRELVQGMPIKDIASGMGKSVETVRSQVKSIMTKFGVSRQFDILSTVEMVKKASHELEEESPQHYSNTEKMISLPDGRQLAYACFGDPNGVPLLFIHDFSAGRHWPDNAKEDARNGGIRVISVSRAGYGASSVNELEGEPLLKAHVQDYFHVLQAENIPRCSMWPMGMGLSIAYQFALTFPQLTHRIYGVNTFPPILSRSDAKNYHKGMYRMAALANLYAPKTMRLMGKFGARRLRSIKNLEELNEMTSIEAGEQYVSEDYYINFLKPNLEDILESDGEGAWRDCTYLSHDWAEFGENLNTRPKTILYQHYDYPFVKIEHVNDFAEKMSMAFYRLAVPHRNGHLSVAPLFQKIRNDWRRGQF